MSEQNKELAFPSHGSMGEVVEKGMTLRDYIAAKAMTSIIINLSKKSMQKLADAEMIRLHFGEGQTDRFVAKVAYDYADAMLKERIK